jgi:predicted DNA-binding transcriptional regulator AlpA
MTFYELQHTPMDSGGISPKSVGAVEIWGIPQIATFLKKGHSTARKYAADEHFPAPIAGEQRNRRWFSDEVIAYFRTNRTCKERPVALSPVPYTPSQIQIRLKKEKAA